MWCWPASTKDVSCLLRASASSKSGTQKTTTTATYSIVIGRVHSENQAQSGRPHPSRIWWTTSWASTGSPPRPPSGCPQVRPPPPPAMPWPQRKYSTRLSTKSNQGGIFYRQTTEFPRVKNYSNILRLRFQIKKSTILYVFTGHRYIHVSSFVNSTVMVTSLFPRPGEHPPNTRRPFHGFRIPCGCAGTCCRYGLTKG